MKAYFLSAAVSILSLTNVCVASPLCDKLKLSLQQLDTFRPHNKSGKVVQGHLSDAIACLNADWQNLSQRLTLRTTPTVQYNVPVTPSQGVTIATYSPAAQYNANIATPIAFLKKPDPHLNYQPSNNGNTPLQQTALHLADEIPSVTYQGSLPTPVLYQTNYWNRDITGSRQ